MCLCIKIQCIQITMYIIVAYIAYQITIYITMYKIIIQIIMHIRYNFTAFKIVKKKSEINYRNNKVRCFYCYNN